MNIRSLKKIVSYCTLLTYMTALITPVAQANPGTLSQVPLYLTTSVQPNVMVLIDNSGSMDNVVWATGYNNATIYPDWGSSNIIDGWGLIYPWSASDGNFSYWLIGQGSCLSGWKEGKNGATTKCLKLPDPVGGGNTRYTGNYLNYLFNSYANNTDLTTGTIPNDYRMNVARTVATNIINTTSGMRFGISSFNPANNTQGGIVKAACGSSTATLTTAISGLYSATWTPLAEAYYEMTRYFRGMSSYYNAGTTYTSPIQYRCQNNFVVVITDGLPTLDESFPSNDPDDAADNSRALPNWDNLAPNTTAAMYPNFPQYSDGFKPETNDAANEAYTLYLDDLAKFGYDIDMKKAPAADLTGTSYDDPKFPKQSLNTYTIGFSVQNQMLQDTASYGHGQYFTAIDASSLTAALQSVIANIFAQTGSISAVAFNTATLSNNSYVYQARYNSGLWSGELLAYALDPNNGNVAAAASWEAGARLNSTSPASRKILTYNPTTKKGTPFTWNTSANGLSASQQADLNMGPSGAADAQGQQRLNYLRGDRTNENNGTYRVRGSVLGDIDHSSPIYVGQASMPYSDNLPLPAGAPVYSTFKASTANRQGVLYVGANDGMLHGFNSTTGSEVVSYVPHALSSSASAQGLHYLTDKNYAHHYYVDLPTTVADAYIATTPGGTVAWKSILVGGLAAGGKGLFAMDVTDPSSFSETNADNTVMWEFTSSDDADLGYTFSKPAIVLMNNGKWAAIFGNGYNDGGSGQAQLFIVYLDGGLDGVWTLGTDYLKITTGVGSAGVGANGLATPAVIDLDGNGTADRVYAGDLQGNMWAFDISASSSGQWGVAYKQGSTPKPLFTAKNAAGTVQPITTKPTVAVNPTQSTVSTNSPNLLVTFGTGQYLISTDSTSTTTQTFYGVWDSGTKNLLRSNLVAQTFLAGYPADTRVLTDNAVNYSSTVFGWYIDLDSTAAATGERVVTNAKIRGNYVFFNTLIPNTAACSSGGSSWLMSVKLSNGGRPDTPLYDRNNNNSLDNADYVDQAARIASAGRKLDYVAADSNFLGAHQYTSNSGNSIDEVLVYIPSLAGTGRMSWKEIRQ